MQICNRCVLDTTVPKIRFDDNGVCNFCHSHDRLTLEYPRGESINVKLNELIKKIKQTGSKDEYDCIIGVSGGTDSSYTLHLAKKLGLRPLAVHFDNGWNTDQAVTNIKKITDKLNVDLQTYVVEWEEFKDLQKSFLKACVPCIEAPSDVGIHGALLKIAEEGIKYILGGQSFFTEGTVPREWSYLDGTYINSIQKKYGSVKLKSFPNLSLSKVFYYTFIKGIREIPFLNYVEYDKAKAKKELAEVFGWTDYGGHHYENIYSKFAFGWFQFRKFNIDKRKVTLSGQIRSGLISKQDALKQLEEKPKVEDETLKYCINKLGISDKEFETIMSSDNKYYYDYFTSANIIKYFRFPIKIAVKMKIFTPVLYEKYFG